MLATRSFCMTPSGMIASGSPFRMLNRRTRPIHLPPGPVGCLSLRMPAGVTFQRIVSEFKRIAAASKRGAMPSIVLNMYRLLSRTGP